MDKTDVELMGGGQDAFQPKVLLTLKFTLDRVKAVESSVNAMKRDNTLRDAAHFNTASEVRKLRAELAKPPVGFVGRFVPFKAEVVCDNCLTAEEWVFGEAGDVVRAQGRCPRCKFPHRDIQWPKAA